MSTAPAKPVEDLYAWLRRQLGANTVALVLLAVGIVWATLYGRGVLAAEAAKSAKAEVEPVDRKATDTQGELTRFKTEMNDRLARFELNQRDDRELALGTGRKLDALLERQRVPNPAPTPADGGPR